CKVWRSGLRPGRRSSRTENNLLVLLDLSFRAGERETINRAGSLADVGQQRHEAGPLDRLLGGALESGAVAAAFAAEQLTLTCAELLKSLHVLVVHEHRPRTAFLGAKAAAVLPAPSEFLANHRSPRRTSSGKSSYTEKVAVRGGAPHVNGRRVLFSSG